MSPDQLGNNPFSTNSVVAGTPAGGGLEYVISLEKALNQEQIHAQHLGKKNETLIKELEELKFQNMQLVHSNQTLYGTNTRGSAAGGGVGGAVGSATGSAAPPLVKQVSINSLDITAGQVAQVISSVQALLKENSKLLEQCETTQKVMKKFFKFQIEEEDMKKGLEQVRGLLYFMHDSGYILFCTYSGVVCLYLVPSVPLHPTTVRIVNFYFLLRQICCCCHYIGVRRRKGSEGRLRVEQRGGQLRFPGVPGHQREQQGHFLLYG